MDSYYFIGIKGTGMASLAVLLKEWGVSVSGCDKEERFSTDSLLQAEGIHVDVGFSDNLLQGKCIDCVVFSSVYGNETPVLAEAIRRGIPHYSYNEYLAKITKGRDSYLVAGTHGKTTVTAMTAFLLMQGERRNYPFSAIFGSNLKGYEKMPDQGKDKFLLEACEYRDHFLSYGKRGALITTIEWDHPDFFPDEVTYYQSFLSFALTIEKGGFLIICVDSKETRRLYREVRAKRSDLNFLPYGYQANGPFRLRRHADMDLYSLDMLEEYFPLPTQSDAWAEDMVGASLLACAMLLDGKEVRLYLPKDLLITDEVFPTLLLGMLKDIPSYPGTVGRMEVMAEQDGVLCIDDYAHHPRQISVVIDALRKRYPQRKLLILFMPHTASRTKALMGDFVKTLSQADKVIVEETFASARNDIEQEDQSMILSKKLTQHMFTHPSGTLSAVLHTESDEETVAAAASWLMDGDILVTMGAGNNRFLTQRILKKRKGL